MKKVLLAAALALLATTASATITGGPHDLGSAANVAKYGAPQISGCQFCHAPHFGAATPAVGAPLWNRNNPASGSFTLYTSNTLSTTAKTGEALGVNSLTCLSCHDGVSDMGNTVVGSKGYATAKVMTGYAVVGTDLTNDHPVGIAFNAADPTLVATVPAVPTSTSVGLENGRVECGSCHDPHGTWDAATGGLSFLRQSSATICAACHNK